MSDFLHNEFSAMTGVLLALVGIVSYLIGNISPATILGKAYGVDITKEGSGNRGATNAVRALGAKAGLITFFADFAKGFFPVFASQMLLGELGGYISGICIVLGHCFPVFYKFKGGKGVAAAVGALMAIDPIIAGICLAIVVILVLLFRYVSLAVLVACVAAVVLAFFMSFQDLPFVAALILIIILKHIPNIKRLATGTENKFSFGTSKKDKEAYEKARAKSKVDYEEEYRKARESK
jgi:glycerol-3-phosphate acyltransferase PlsY